MEIRSATKKDIDEISKLMLSSFTKPPFKEKDNIKAVKESLNFYFKIGKSFIAVENKEIIGVIIFKTERYWEGEVVVVEDLAVKEEDRDQGVGHKLMLEVEKYAKKNKAKKVSFDTHKKSSAVKFYKEQGYKINQNTVSLSKKIR